MAHGCRSYDRIQALLQTAKASAEAERRRLCDLEVSRASAVTELEWLGQSERAKGGEAATQAAGGVLTGSVNKRAVLAATINTLLEEITACSEALAACEWEATKLVSLLQRFEADEDEPEKPAAEALAGNSRAGAA